MNKTLKIVLISLLVLVVGGYVGAELFLGSIVKHGVNRFAPGITQTTVVLGGATISPLSGSGTLKGLVIGNPKGWSENNFCTLGKIHIDVAPMSLLGDRILVEAIEIEAPEFNYETKLIASNVNDLLKNIEQATGGKAPADAKAPADGGKPVKLEVKKFRLVNGKVRVGVGAAGLTLPLPPIELTDIGTAEGGVPPDRIAFAVMKRLTPEIIGATARAAGEIGKTGGAAAAEGVKKTGEAIKGLFGGGKE